MKLLKLTLKNPDILGRVQYALVAADLIAIASPDHNRDGKTIGAVLEISGVSTPLEVTEPPEAIAAMLAEPVADNRTPAGLAVDGWRATVGGDGQPDREIVGIEPLAGACVRTLPTPQGARRFLCLPEVDMTTPVEPGRHLIRLRDCWDITPMATTNEMRADRFLDAIYGPLEEVVP